ncbi:MAG: metal-dependent phosphohydrolase, partial [Opitutales bacterium]
MPDLQPSLIRLDGDFAPVRRVVELLRDAGGRPVLVGGCVRDALMQVPVLDVDVEVYGLGTRQVEAALRKEFGIITVGAAFGVTKLKDFPVDVSVPRRENRTGAKHTDFDVQADPTMTPKDAAERRDFTLNAIMWDP